MNHVRCVSVLSTESVTAVATNWIKTLTDLKVSFLPLGIHFYEFIQPIYITKYRLRVRTQTPKCVRCRSVYLWHKFGIANSVPGLPGYRRKSEKDKWRTNTPVPTCTRHSSTSPSPLTLPSCHGQLPFSLPELSRKGDKEAGMKGKSRQTSEQTQELSTVPTVSWESEAWGLWLSCVPGRYWQVGKVQSRSGGPEAEERHGKSSCCEKQQRCYHFLVSRLVGVEWGCYKRGNYQPKIKVDLHNAPQKWKVSASYTNKGFKLFISLLETIKRILKIQVL